MYCKYCGQQIDDNAQFCPYCGKNLKQEAYRTTSKKKQIQKHKLSTFVTLTVLTVATVLTCVSLIFFVFKGKNKDVIEQSNAVAEAFNNTEMESINKIIFNENEIKEYDEFNELSEEETEEVNEGVLESIFKHVTVKVDNITDNNIVYRIKAPDMKNVFANLNANAESLSKEELLQLIKDYAANTSTIEEIVSLDYSIVDGQLIVNYRDKSFINAVTGGFLEAYISLYDDMINEIAEGMK